MIMISLIPMVL